MVNDLCQLGPFTLPQAFVNSRSWLLVRDRHTNKASWRDCVKIPDGECMQVDSGSVSIPMWLRRSKIRIFRFNLGSFNVVYL